MTVIGAACAIPAPGTRAHSSSAFLSLPRAGLSLPCFTDQTPRHSLGRLPGHTARTGRSALRARRQTPGPYPGRWPSPEHWVSEDGVWEQCSGHSVRQETVGERRRTCGPTLLAEVAQRASERHLSSVPELDHGPAGTDGPARQATVPCSHRLGKASRQDPVTCNVLTFKTLPTWVTLFGVRAVGT